MENQVGYNFDRPERGNYYEHGCPILTALEIIGGKWKLPILWNLAADKVSRYNELRRNMRGVTNIMLTKCLRELEQAGLVHREQYNEVPPRVEYSLTDEGLSLLPALNNLFDWGVGLQQKNSSAKINTE